MSMLVTRLNVLFETVEILDFRQGLAELGIKCAVELFDQTDCNTTPCPKGLTSLHGKCQFEN